MQRGFVSAIVLTTVFLLGAGGPAFAAGRYGGFHGAHGDHAGIPSHGAWNHGAHGHFEGPPHGNWHGGFRGHHGFGARVFVGPGFGWHDPWWWGPDYPYYTAPPEVVPPAGESGYWYYCPNPPGYYPYVTQCPSGWIAVVPPANPPAP